MPGRCDSPAAAHGAGFSGIVSQPMRKFVLVLVLLLIVVAVGGFFVLASWDIPAPTTTMEKVVPNERLTQ
jgi:hypothetical protein